MKKDYKKKYRILVKGTKEIIRNLKNDIYNEKLPPTALRYMSDLKYYLWLSFYYENQKKKMEKFLNEHK